MKKSIAHPLASIIVSSIFVLGAAACGGGGGTSSPAVQSPVANPDSRLIGFFQEPRCQRNGGLAGNTATRFKSDGTYEFIYTAYLFENCSEPAYIMTYSGNYFEGGTSALADGRELVALDLQQTTQRAVTPLSEFVADGLNNDSVCDITDWQPMVSQTIADCQLIGNRESIIQPTIYQVYHLQDNHYLYLSQETSFVPENRPANLPVVPLYTRELAPSDDFPANVMGVWRTVDSSLFLEFRPDGILYVYTLSDESDACFRLSTGPFLHQGFNVYIDHDGDGFELSADGDVLEFGLPGDNDSGELVRDATQTLQQLALCG